MTIEIDHTSLSVSDYEKAKAFYAAALAPLGVGVQMEFPMDGGSTAGIGTPGKPFLWIGTSSGPVSHVHLALRAENRGQVDAFHKAALAAGGRDNGPPGLRPHYHQHYYAAFVLDPDGHNIEAVVHTPPAPAKPARRAAKATTAKSAKKPVRKAVKKPARVAARKPAKTLARRKPAKRK